MKLLNKKINALWQCKRSDFGGKGLLWMALFLIAICISLGINLLFIKDNVFIVFAYYLIFAFFSLVIMAVFTYIVVYNKRKIPDVLVRVIISLYKLILIECFIICIPIMIFLKITEVILNYRAKKIDNLTNWLLILVIDLSVICIFIYCDILLAVYISSYVNLLSEMKYHFTISIYALELFFVLTCIKLEVDLINKIVLKIMNKYGMIKIERRVKEKKARNGNIPVDLDIKKYVDNKNKEIEIYKEMQTETLKYGLEYQKKTLWKFQLICLIALFLIATFAPDTIYENQSDAINVITVFTLIMLYLDKRKEWK